MGLSCVSSFVGLDQEFFGTESVMNKNTLVCIIKLTKLFPQASSIQQSSCEEGGLIRTVLGCNARKLQNLKLDFIEIDQELEDSISVTPRRKIRLGD